MPKAKRSSPLPWIVPLPGDNIPQAYRDAKASHPGMVLLFRIKDFYHAFQEDAELLSNILGLTVTTVDYSITFTWDRLSKTEESRLETMLMVVFPVPSLQEYLQKLLRAGHRVALLDQVVDTERVEPREVKRVVVPGSSDLFAKD